MKASRARGAAEIGVVIPACNEEGNIEPLVAELHRVLRGHRCQILFVDDGSTDATLEAIIAARRRFPAVEYLSLTRNFGHQHALKAGLDHVAGKCVITMDADLQHPPSVIPRLLERWREGWEIVSTIRDDDASVPWIKRATARLFYRLVNLIAEVKIAEGAADFRLLDRSVVEVLRRIDEYHPFFRGLVPWTGFRQTSVRYRPARRHSGRTKYSFWRMVSFALGGLVSFSIIPLRLATVLGFIMALTGFGIGLKATVEYLVTRDTAPGWTSTIVVVVLVGGVQLVILGIMGEYLGRMFMEAKKRPTYIVRAASKRIATDEHRRAGRRLRDWRRLD
ncbi:MAG: hypothetical protein A2177_14365 [Spirochaetes bacterium RBG_13_68_11]|nr:MAG: hypothetical protein A2177_14365 [Spirochaetes bacterium RBG_13_68_11]